MYQKLLEENVREGVIHLHLPNGKHHRFGRRGREAHWIMNSERVIKKIARDWEYQLGETYVQGQWDVEKRGLRDLLYILYSNFRDYPVHKWLKPAITALQQWNRLSRSFGNVSHHYDLGEQFFRLFLDKEMHYSCGYFANSHCSL